MGPRRHPAHVLANPRWIRNLAELLLPLHLSGCVFGGVTAKSYLSCVDGVSSACKQSKTGDGPSHGGRTPLDEGFERSYHYRQGRQEQIVCLADQRALPTS